MITVSDRHVTGGVDTHGDFHVAGLVESTTNREIADATFPATAIGYESMLAWMAEHGQVDEVGVESTGSFGAGLTRFLQKSGIGVIEVDRPDRKTRRFDGKTDTIDAYAAARAVVSGRANGTPKSRDGLAEAVRAIEIVCHGATKDRTRAINQFKALLITAPTGLRERMNRETFRRQLELSRRFRTNQPDPTEANLRMALKQLARRIEFLTEQIDELEQQLNTLCAQANRALLGAYGVGPHNAAQLLTAAGDNPQRITSESAFAKLCGVCPIPASSGKTERHRLNRAGDRRANNALYNIVLVRMRYDQRTRDYVERRTADGKTKPEIIRCLKRYVAREIYQLLTNPPEIPIGHNIRQQRENAGITLTRLALELDVAPITISRIERHLDHNNTLAQQAQTWLNNNT